MRKVLILTKSYYPGSSSGAHRPTKMAKYLPEFGWEPVVVCRSYHPDSLTGAYDAQLAKLGDTCRVKRVRDVENRVFRKMEATFWNVWGAGDYDSRFPYLFYRRMKRAAEEIIKREHIDVIWATSLPNVVHRVADRLSRRYAIPWVADFRDLPDRGDPRDGG